jgi:hypothetical protein
MHALLLLIPEPLIPELLIPLRSRASPARIRLALLWYAY